jgi:hypothetical protein
MINYTSPSAVNALKAQQAKKKTNAAPQPQTQFNPLAGNGVITKQPFGSGITPGSDGIPNNSVIPFTAQSAYQPSGNSFGLPTSNVPPVTIPQFGDMTHGKTLTAGEMLNIQRRTENALNAEQAMRQQQGLDSIRQGQDNVRNLYGQSQGQINTGYDSAQSQVANMYNAALNDVSNMGQQAHNRINDQERQNIARAQGTLTSRGLGNSTLTQTVGRGFQRDANDARLGVDESKARQSAGIRMGLGDRFADLGVARGGDLAGNLNALGGSEIDFSRAIAEYLMNRSSNPTEGLPGGLPATSRQRKWYHNFQDEFGSALGNKVGSSLGQGVMSGASFLMGGGGM